MNYNSPLDPSPNQGMSSSGSDNLGVKAALNLISSNYEIKVQRDTKNNLITALFESGFEVSDPTGARKITAAMLQQSMWRTMNRLKPLDYQIHGTGRPQAMEDIVTKGVETEMDNSGFVQTLRDKHGVFWNMALFGDGFYLVSVDDDGNIKYRPIPNSNVYVDNYATGIRCGASPATQMCVIFSMSYGEACKIYPKMKTSGGAGMIPRQINRLTTKETGRTFYQTWKLSDITEIAFFFDIRTKRFTVFGGQACTVLEDYKKDKYPFVKDDKPYIPVGQFVCMPSAEGFWNHGLGDMLYRMAVITRQMMNMALGHAEDNVYPITLVNIPQKTASDFFNSLKEAHKSRTFGKKPMVPVEYDPNNPNSGRVSAQSLITQSLVNEWQLLYDQMNREIRRLGINLDDIEKGPDITATQIIAEEENSNAFVKQIMEFNASEMQFAVELTMDFMKKFVKRTDKKPINLTTNIQVEGMEIKPKGITRGMIADELRKNNYFVIVNSRSGALPSNIMEQAQISRMIGITPPGSPAWTQLWEELAHLNNRDMDKSMMMPQQSQGIPQGGQGMPQGGGKMSPIPSETDRILINPQAAKNPVPAL